jgi:hypothetical protein
MHKKLNEINNNNQFNKIMYEKMNLLIEMLENQNKEIKTLAKNIENISEKLEKIVDSSLQMKSNSVSPSQCIFPDIENTIENWKSNVSINNKILETLFGGAQLKTSFQEIIIILNKKEKLPFHLKSKIIYVKTSTTNNWDDFEKDHYNSFVICLWQKILQYYLNNSFSRETIEQEDKDHQLILSIRKTFCDVEKNKKQLIKFIKDTILLG